MLALTSDGVALWWESEGAGTPALLVPGRGDASDVYPARFSDALIQAGCQVIRFDPRDTGLSGDGGSAYTNRDMADDAMAVLDAAAVPVAHIVGHLPRPAEWDKIADRVASHIAAAAAA